MNKTLLATCVALSLCSYGYAEEQFTNSASDRFVTGLESTVEENTIKEAKDIKDTRTPEEKKAKTPMPINLSADHCDYDSTSGEFHVSGNVVITQGIEKLMTTEAWGNLKTGDVFMEKGGAIVEKNSKSSGKWAHYNFNNKTGEIKEITGITKKDSFSASHAVVTPEKIILDEGGTSSRCPAKVHPSCFSISAKTIEVFPGAKVVAKDVKVFVRGKHVYSRDRWVNTFDDNTTRIMPRVGWGNRHNGAYIKLDVSQPIGNQVNARLLLPKYTKAGYKPVYSLNHTNKNFNLSYKNGWEEDDDIWYRKQNTWRFSYKPHHIVKGLPISYSGYFEYGLWKRQNRNYQSWHRESAIYLNHDPIHLFNSRKNSLNLTVGKKWVHESYTKELVSTKMYYASFAQEISPKWTVWNGYYQEDKTSNLFNLGQPDMAKEWRIGVKFQPDRANTFSIVNRFDTEKGHEYETDYKWYHRFCCWSLELVFEDEKYKNDHSFKVHWYFDNF